MRTEGNTVFSRYYSDCVVLKIVTAQKLEVLDQLQVTSDLTP
jgi:hypothetical protein